MGTTVSSEHGDDGADGDRPEVADATRWRLLLDATLALAENPDPATILDRIVTAARHLVGARFAALGVVSEDGATLDDFIHSGLPDDHVTMIGQLPIGKGILGELLVNPVPLRLRDLRSHHGSVGFPLHHPQMHSFLGVPVRNRAGVVGNLYFAEKEDGGEFSAQDQAIVEAFAAQAGVAIENARLYEQRRVDAAHMSALFRSVQAITQARDRSQVLQVIVDAARELVDAEYAALGVLGRDGTLEEFIHSGLDAGTVAKMDHMPEGRGLLGTVTVEGRPLRLRDLTEHPSAVGFPPHHPMMRSFMGVPIRSTTTGVIGNIYLTNKRRDAEFSTEDEELIGALAGQAAIAIENSLSYDRERLLVKRMEALMDANLSLTQELHLENVLQRVVGIVRELADAEYAALAVFTDDGDEIESFIHSGMDQELVERIGPLPRGRGVLRAVMVSNRPIRIPRLADHPASVGFPEHHPPMDAFLGVPVEYAGHVFGNLYLTNKIGGVEFTAEDELVVSGLAAQAAVSIQNARTYRREQELVGELRTLNDAKSEFVSTVSHELRSPLSALTGLASTVGRHWKSMDEPQLQEAFDGIARQAVRLTRLVDELLDLSRMEAGRLNLDLHAVTVHHAVESALEGAGARQSVAVTVDVDPAIAVVADGARLDQVLVNLINNAARHGGPNITIRATRVDDGMIDISVSDDGPGVGPDVLPRLFERFARGRNPGGGTGLGLAISKALSEAMRGTLRHEPAVGGGATFHIRLQEARS